MEAEQFEFKLVAFANNPAGDPVKTEVTAKNSADGSVTFDGLTYKEAGTYQYTLSEVKGELPGVSYDGAQYTVTVEVTDQTSTGKLVATATITKDGNAVEKVVFENKYDPTDIEVSFGGTKTFTDVSLDSAKVQD